MQNKKIYALTFFLLLFYNIYSQCLICEAQNPSSVISGSDIEAEIGHWNIVTNNFKANDYAVFNLKKGYTYEWEVCGEANFETPKLSLFTGTVCNSQNFTISNSGSCAIISFIATKNQNVTILLADNDCGENPTNLTMKWRTTCRPPNMAKATTDHLGLDWIISSDQFIEGNHINVNNFIINAGVTATLSSSSLHIEAINITINGTIDGNYKGAVGGTGGAGGNASIGGDGVCNSGGVGQAGTDGNGSGPGFHGGNGLLGGCTALDCSLCTNGYIAGSGGAGSGGGGAHFDDGGTSGSGAQASDINGTSAIGGFGGNGPWFGAFAYGDNTSESVLPGSGGAGGGGGGGGYTAGTNGGDGGAGGGQVELIAFNDIIIGASGEIFCNGYNGGNGGNGGYGSLDNSYECFDDNNLENTDNCVTCPTIGNFYGSGGAGGGAGGGSGGGILISSANLATILGTLEVAGGEGGDAGFPNSTHGTCFRNAKGGSGGVGGRIKIFRNPCLENQINPTINVLGGLPGTSIGGSVERAASGIQLLLDHPSYIPFDQGQIATNQNICESGVPNPISISTNPSGGIGTYTYQWWKCTAADCTTPPVGYTPIGGATTDSYSPPALTGTTYYSLMVQSGSEECREWTEPVIINVHPDPSISILASENDVCENEPLTITATVSGGTGSCTILWQYSDDGTTWNNVGTNNTTYNVPTTTAFSNRQYRATYNCTADGCDLMISNIEIINVAEAPEWDVITVTPPEICLSGDVTFDATITGGLGGTIEWFISPSGASTWSPVTSPDNPGLGAWDYQPVYTPDGAGCDIDDAPINTVNVVDDPIISISTTDTETCENTPLTLTASASGGSGTCSYQWQYWDGSNWINVGTDSDTYILPANTPSIGTRYRCLYTCDGEGCNQAISNELIIVVLENPDVVATANPNPQCSAEPVDLSASASNGTAPYIYDWDNGLGIGQNHTVNPTTNTTYTVTVADDNGCTAETSVNVIVNDLPNVIASANPNPICANQQVDLNATGSNGLAPYNYVWDNGLGIGQNHTVFPTSNTSYTVTITDDNGCTNENTVNVLVHDIPNLTVTETSQATCGANNGEATATPSGGTSPYDFSWNNGDTSPDGIAENLAPGLISVTVTDDNGCTISGSVIITSPSSIVITTSEISPITCYGGNDGIGNIDITGGTTPYDVQWSNGITNGNNSGLGEGNFDINNLTGGTYIIQITDADNCVETETLVINEPNEITLNTNIISTPQCFGDSDGEAELTFAGGIANYDFNWDNGSVNGSQTGVNGGPHTLTNLDAGTYNVSVTDANLCTANFTFDITQPDEIVITPNMTSEPSCNGFNDATADITISGGTLNYNFTWDNGSVSGFQTNTNGGPHNLIDLDAGTYTISVTDANSCTQTTNLDITEPTAISSNLNLIQGVSCYNGSNGSFSVTISGGISDYDIIYDNGTINGSLINVGIGPNNITNLEAGTYLVTVLDNNGCSSTNTIDVNEPNEIILSANMTTEVSCYSYSDGEAEIDISGGIEPYDLNWDNGTTNGSINGVSSGITSINGLSAGTYTITATDSNLCTNTTTLNVTEPPQITNVINITSNASCFGSTDGGFDILISGGTANYDLNWSNGTYSDNLVNADVGPHNITNIPGGNYSLTISDANTCEQIETFTIIEPTDLILTQNNTSNVSCLGGTNGSIELNVGGGTPLYDLSWDNGSTNGNLTSIPNGTQTLNNLDAGTYSILLTDNNSCTTSIAVLIEEPASILNLTVISTGDATCVGVSDGSAIVEATGGVGPYTYTWDNPNGVDDQITNVTAGTYNVTVTDDWNCSVAIPVIIGQPANGLSATYTTTDVSCPGGNDGNIILAPSGGTAPYTYNWNPNVSSNETGSNLSVNTYNVTINDAGSCELIMSIDVELDPNALNVEFINSDSVNCYGLNDGSLTIIATGGQSPYSYSWSNGSISETTTGSAGSYTVSVTDANMCLVTADSIIYEPNELSASVLTFSDVNCHGGTNGEITISVTDGTPPYTYYWEDAAGTNMGISTATAASLSAGTYYITITDNNGCGPVEISQTINEPASELTVTINEVNQPSCNGDSDGSITAIESGGTLPINNYSWEFPIDFFNGQTPAGLESGNYEVTITDANGCTATNTFTLNQPNILNININSNEPLCNGDANGNATALASGGNGNFSYHWEDALGTTLANTDILNNISSGTYYVSATDILGCSISSSIYIDQPAILSATLNGIDASSYGNNDGSATANPIGGTSPYTYEWENQTNPGVIISTNQIADNLITGTYCVTITDDNLCTFSNCILIDQPPDQLAGILASHEDITCYGYDDGSITINGYGGTPPYIWTWEHPLGTVIGTGSTINDLEPGDYYFTIADQLGYEWDTIITIVEPTEFIFTSISNTNVSCYNGSNAYVEVQVSGGTQNYNYSWENLSGSIPQNNDTIYNLPAGNYSVTITDANGCGPLYSNTIVTQPDELTIEINLVNYPLCYGSSNGEINCVANGGTPAYTAYAWAAPINTYTGTNPTNLTAGNYSVTVTDTNLCTAETNYTLNEPAALGGILAATPTTGFGSSDGEVSVFGTGGTPVYSYEWEDQANPGVIISTNPTVQNLPAGTYCVTVYDNNACEYSECIEVMEPEELVVTIDDTQIDCNGNDNGSVTAIVTGGVPDYTYEWRNSSNILISTDQTVNNLIPDTYFITVTDIYGYTASSSVIITEPDEIISPISSISHVSCFGFNDGNVTLNVSGGVTPYIISWYEENSPSVILSTNSILNNVPAGNYVFSLIDANNCTHDTIITITQPESINISGLETHDLPCPYDINTGWAVVNFSGGSPNYSFTWLDENLIDLGINNDSIFNLTPGSYSIEINDNNGCPSDTYTFNINVPEPFNLSGTTDSVNCFNGTDGAIELSLTGGTPEYNYSWTPDLGNTSNPENISAGSYDVIITDANSCTISSTFNVGQPLSPLDVITGQTDFIYCFNDTTAEIQLNINGGTLDYVISWENTSSENGNFSTNHEGISLIQNIGAGDYIITITDSRNCEITDAISISQPENITYEFSDIIEPSCNSFNDGSINIDAEGGTGTLSYLWDDMIVPITHNFYSNIHAGWHYITITDANSCQKFDSVFIDQPDILTSNLIDTLWVLCYNDSTANTMININGGTPEYNTIWYNSSYEELGNETWISNLSAGEYYLSITDSHFCIYEDTLTVSEPPPLSSQMDSINPSCYMYQDGKIWTTISGGTPSYNYEWDTPGAMNSDTAFSVPQGMWHVTITDSNMCKITDSLELIHPDDILITDSTTHVDCSAFMGTSTISVSGGTSPYTYLWDNGEETSFVMNLPGGNHNVQITDSHGCTKPHTITVPVVGNNEVNIIQSQYILCYGDYSANIHAEVFGHPPFSYNWNIEPSIDTSHYYNLPAGDYYLIVTDSWNCVGDTTYTVTQPDDIDISFTSQDVLCRNDSTGWITTTISGGTGNYTLDWQHTDNDNPNIYYLPVGTYYLNVTDANNCEANNSIRITEPDSSLLATYTVTGSTCFNSDDGQANAQAFGGTPPYSYFWSGPNNHNINEQSTNNNLFAGIYGLTVTDANQCKYYTRVSILEPGPIQIHVSQYMGPSCLGNTDGYILLDSIIGGTPPFWIRITGNQESWEQQNLLIDSLAGGSYQIDVIDSNNCIQWENSTALELIDANIDCLQIPAAFSPNNDGHNDYWRIDNLHMFPKIIIQVYNRWGQLLYEAGAFDELWDGTFNGNPVPTGAYLYHIDMNNDLPPRIGTVTIVR